MDQWRIGFQQCVGIYQQCVRVLCYEWPISPSSSLPLLSLFCFLQPAWFWMVGGDRSFKLALKEENDEFSNELREDCKVRVEGGDGGEREWRGKEQRGGEGNSATEVVSTHYINSVCWSGSAL